MRRRLAFVTPVPPAPTGIADYSAEVIALLADRHRIDVFHDQDELQRDRLPPSCGVFPAGWLLERHRAEAYDLAVFQMGNSVEHAFLYDLLPRLPGLLVLHDLVLHHARARAFLDSAEARAYREAPWDKERREAANAIFGRYRAELAYSYPEVAERLFAAQLGTVGDLLPYAYPLFRLPVEASRVTAVHNAYMAAAIRSEVLEARVAEVAMPAIATPAEPEDVAALRARLGIEPDELAVGCFGLMTREKRIETVARAVARAATSRRVRLLLVGPVPDREALSAILERTGVGERAVVTGKVPFAALPAHMDAADLVVHLRYPTARETSAALLRVLAQGRPTIVPDLDHLADLPADVAYRANVTDEEGEVTRAILRLGDDPAGRARLGRKAADFVQRAHSPDRCRETYEAAIERAIRSPNPAYHDWPAHWAHLQPAAPRRAESEAK